MQTGDMSQAVVSFECLYVLTGRELLKLFLQRRTFYFRKMTLPTTERLRLKGRMGFSEESLAIIREEVMRG